MPDTGRVIPMRRAGEPPEPGSILATADGARALAAILLHKLGGKAVLTAADFQAILGYSFMESNEPRHTALPTGEGLAVWIEDMRAPGGKGLQ